MGAPIWKVKCPGLHDAEVVAEAWWVTENGDLLLGQPSKWTTHNGMSVLYPPVPSRGFAAGMWTEISLFA